MTAIDNIEQKKIWNISFLKTTVKTYVFGCVEAMDKAIDKTQCSNASRLKQYIVKAIWVESCQVMTTIRKSFNLRQSW